MRYDLNVQHKNWISVKEQLPGLFTRVYVAKKDAFSPAIHPYYHKIMCLGYDGKFFDVEDPTITYSLRVITHWCEINKVKE